MPYIVTIAYYTLFSSSSMKSLLICALFSLFLTHFSYADYIEEIPNISAREIAMMAANEQPDIVGKGFYISSEQKHKMNVTQVRKCSKKPASKLK